MPALLTPRKASKAAAEDEAAKKSKGGVMGRLKSTFKLGRRKSSSSSSSAPSTDNVPDVAAVDVAPTTKDLPQHHPESRVSTPSRTAEHDEDDRWETQQSTSAKAQAPPPPPPSQQQQEEREQEDAEDTEVKHFDPRDVSDDVESEEQVDVGTSRRLSALLDDRLHPRAAAVSPRKPKSPRAIEPSEDDVDDADGDEEVFASDYKSTDGPHVDEVKSLDDDAEPEQNNATSDAPSGGAADLMIIGVSPAKFRSPSGPSVSPIKRLTSQPPLRLDTDTALDNQAGNTPLGDRIASAHSSRGTRPTAGPSAGLSAAPTPSSPMRRRPSDGLGESATSPVPRRGAPSPKPRRSFHRDDEQQIATPASPPRKPDTPSAVPSTRMTGQRPERRQSLRGIREEPERPEPERPSSPRRVSRGWRRADDAPILASAAFGGCSAAPEPEVPEELDANGSHASSASASASPHESAEDDEAERATSPLNDKDSDDTGAGAFAFDAGAAITQEFGERVARLLGADPWGDRQDGFDAIQYLVKKTDLATAPNRRELFCAAVAAVQCGVEDRVAPVMYCALECLRAVLKEFAPVIDRAFLRYQPLNEQLSLLIKAVVGKLGDSNKRTRREATQAVVRLTKLKKLRALPHVLLHLSAREVTPRLRVELLRTLVNEVGVDGKSGLQAEVVMQFAVPALKIADEKTRKAAVELIAELHAVNSAAVNAQLVGVKPEMLRVINRRVEELAAKREAERLQAAATQSANQADESHGAGDDESAMELVAVPSDDAKATVALLDAQQQHAQSVVGPVAWRKLESKTWSDRKEALVDIEKGITDAKSDLRDVRPAFGSVVQHNFAAYCAVVHKCLGDSIAPVVNGAMDCFSTLLKVFGPCVEWRDDPVRDLILLTTMRLFATMQKPNNRANRAACRCVLKLTRLPSPHPLRYALSCVFAKETDALVQMHLLRLLIPEFGFQADGISAGRVLDAVAIALGHSNEKVRKTAMDVALCTQRLIGRTLVLQKLKDVKPVTLKELEKQFVDEIPKDSERPQTVHASAVPSTGGLPPVQLLGGGEHSRRLLQSAPVGVGKLQCTPPTDDDALADDASRGTTAVGATGGASAALSRRNSVLSNEEENLMDSILGNDDF
ncbi:hypothetical protein PINS_up001575 [Pythium insidiosum]|nr:hypothetical protein PINS_up001575 [Pythium insidiosum]